MHVHVLSSLISYLNKGHLIHHAALINVRNNMHGLFYMLHEVEIMNIPGTILTACDSPDSDSQYVNFVTFFLQFIVMNNLW